MKNFEDLKKDFIDDWRMNYKNKDCECLSGGIKYDCLDLEGQYEYNKNLYEIDFEDETIIEEMNEISRLSPGYDIDFYEFLDYLSISYRDLIEIDESIDYFEIGITTLNK